MTKPLNDSFLPATITATLSTGENLVAHAQPGVTASRVLDDLSMLHNLGRDVPATRVETGRFPALVRA